MKTLNWTRSTTAVASNMVFIAVAAADPETAAGGEETIDGIKDPPLTKREVLPRTATTRTST